MILLTYDSNKGIRMVRKKDRAVIPHKTKAQD